MAAAAVAAQSAKARKNPSAALDFVQKEYMAIDDAEKKKCVSVVEEESGQKELSGLSNQVHNPFLSISFSSSWTTWSG